MCIISQLSNVSIPININLVQHNNIKNSNNKIDYNELNYLRVPMVKKNRQIQLNNDVKQSNSNKKINPINKRRQPEK